MKDPKITRPVGVNKDGYASGGVRDRSTFSEIFI